MARAEQAAEKVEMDRQEKNKTFVLLKRAITCLPLQFFNIFFHADLHKVDWLPLLLLSD